MQEACFCGRVGEIEDREPIVDANGERVLRCPNDSCGHLDYLRGLADDARLRIFDEAAHRRSVASKSAA